MSHHDTTRTEPLDVDGRGSPLPVRRGRPLLVPLVALLALGLVLWWLVPRNEDAPPAAMQSSARHVEGPVSYARTPPVEGDHHPVWWDCGVYGAEIPEEHAVHSLEHGAVWITYRADASAADLARLRPLAERTYMLMSPVADQEWMFAATAWGHQLVQDTLDLAAVEAFVRTHRQGPGAPERGALCTNGTTKDLVKR